MSGRIGGRAAMIETGMVSTADARSIAAVVELLGIRTMIAGV